MRLSTKVPKIISLLAVVVLILVYRFAIPQQPVTHPAPTSVSPLPTPTPGNVIVTPGVSETQILGETDETLLFPVVKVVDGDTITVLINNHKETVRLIGINTPETVDPRRGVECFGTEASAYAKSLLTNTAVRLVSDPTQANLDRYNRLLRYVYLPDGRLFNQIMIEEGYAYEYTYNSPYRFQEAFKQAEITAREQKRGLWNDQTCRGTR